MPSQALNCPNCGAGIELRGMGRTLSAVCINCLSVLDTQTPALQVLQQFSERDRVQPLIPLGTRGKLHGDPWEAIGFQQRTITVEGVEYSWREYVLFNPYKGFRYLSEYNGHWNDIIPLHTLPTPTTAKGRKAQQVLGETFAHFQNAVAETTFVMGEFPWQARVGERVVTDDYVSPPRILSSETTPEETVWSLGEYKTGAEIWQAFGLKTPVPPAHGVFANQPSPHTGQVGSIWRTALWLMVALFALMFGFGLFSQNKEVFRDRFYYVPGGAESSFVTKFFDLQGRDSNVEIEIKTDLMNDGTFFMCALIENETGRAYTFARQIGYYSGRDSDGAWSEGDRNDSVIIAAVPKGRYYLRIEPEMDELPPGAVKYGRRVNYEVVVRRDVPSYWLFWLAVPLLIVPPIWKSIQVASFEGQRWQESDYAVTASESEDDDE